MNEKEQTSTLNLRKGDPYKEFELYLQTAQNEIGKVFQDATTSSKDGNVIRNLSNGDYKSPSPQTWIGESNREKGVKALVQLEALLHGLSKTQNVEEETRGSDHISPLLRQSTKCLTKKLYEEKSKVAPIPPERDEKSPEGDVGKMVDIGEVWWNSSKTDENEMLPHNIPLNSLKKRSAHDSLQGNCQCSKNYSRPTREGQSVTNMDALSSWAEKLVYEMNSMSEEDEEKNSKISGGRREESVRWRMRELNDGSANDLRPDLTKAVTCKRCSSIDPVEEIADKKEEKTLQESSSTDSSELFEDACEGPLVEKVKEVMSPDESPIESEVDLTFASPLSVVQVRVRSSSSSISANPPAFHRLSVEYCSRGEDGKLTDPSQINNRHVVGEKREESDHVTMSWETVKDELDTQFQEVGLTSCEEKGELKMEERKDASHLEESGIHEYKKVEDQDYNCELLDPGESHLSRLSSTTSTLSSSGSQMKPEDVQEFIRRVETSIWESESLKRRKKGLKTEDFVSPTSDDAFQPLTEEDEDANRHSLHVATQTSPCVSRSSSIVWVTSEASSVAERIRDNSEVATAGSLSVSCSSIDILSTVSASSTFGEETSDVDQSTSDTTTTTTEFALCLDDDICTVDDPNAIKNPLVGRNIFLNHEKLINSHLVTPQKFLIVSNEDVWVRREDVESQTSRSPVDETSTVNVRPPPPPPHQSNPKIFREVNSESNISKETSESNEKSSNKTNPVRPLILRSISSPSTSSSVASTPSPQSPPSSAHPQSTPPPLSILNTTPKSSSAPILDVRNLSVPTDGDTSSDLSPKFDLSSLSKTLKVIPPPRSQSVKELAELEAVEACQWLRAAGFPQYSQMFEDMQFPINVAAVQKDHYFLDADSIQSLFRRLNALNKCARMRLDSIPRKSVVEDSDEEGQCALSENWTFERNSRRWSRIHTCLDPCVNQITPLFNGQREITKNGTKMNVDSNCESPVAMDEDVSTPVTVASVEKSEETNSPTPETRCTAFRRSGSERLKDGARAFLRRMESFKSKRTRRHNREVVVISGPQVMDSDVMDQRVQQLACVDLSPQVVHRRNNLEGDDAGSLNSASDSSQNTTPVTRARSRSTGGCRRSPSQPRSDSETTGGISDPEYSPPFWRAHNVASKLVIENCVPRDSENILPESDNLNFRTGSFHMRSCNHVDRKKQKTVVNSRTSVYDNVPPPSIICNKYYNHKQEENKRKISFLVEDGKKVNDEKCSACLSLHHESDSGSSASTNLDECGKSSQENKSQEEVVFAPSNNSVRKLSSGNHRRGSSGSVSLSINALSAGQLMVLRKLSLLKLTALMERYSPSNRSGWSWIMPKFIKRMKVPDYKDKVVFGVPLTVIHQRTGQPLPPSIQAAILFLKKNAMDSVGIFRKSGVRSRIQKLKNMCEANPINISFDGQQTYDVADMLKQYFRELPEALLTNKMSETFISIYQYIPEELRLEAVQSVVMLIPEENREILQKLLSFLYDVSLQAQENQMTASNLAVCFAPSLFHMNTPRSSSSSPRRRKTVGIPDQKELNENRAAHDCLTQLIRDHKKIFTVPEDTSFHCRVSYVEDDEPMSLSEISSLSGSEGNWKTYLNMCIQNHFKECREKAKGWVNISTHENAELAYKKVGDGNPLRLWKVTVEVEAPPIELLNRVLRERHLWDDQLLKWRVLTKLDSCTEIFHYVQNSMTPLPAKDFCVLRSWRSDLPKGTCVLVESSLDYAEAPLLLGDVRGLVLVSRYLIEPCGSGKSRIIYISRIDTKGRSLEWYNRVYGHICALHLLRIGNSFRHNAEGPESKV